VDYWALGILIFELTAGYCPFVGDDNMQIYRLIVENKIEFPTHTTPLLRDIVRDFTRSSQLQRLGIRRPGTKAIREHSWFNGFDWAGLENLSMAPPIPTKVRSKTDISNFEEYTGSEQDEIEAVPCDWRPAFPYEVVNGKTQLLFKS
jgi:serine/threonine protein kinase